MEPPVSVKKEADAAFDSAELEELRRHYYDPVVVENAKLPGGRVIRRQTRPPRIKRVGCGYDALRERIAELEKKGDDAAVYNLLRQLRAFELRPPSLGGAELTGDAAQDDPEAHEVTTSSNLVQYIIILELT